MSIENDEILQSYVEESQEHLADIENDLLIIEKAGADIDEELVNKVFRAAHSIKGGAGFLGQNNIKELSHKIENVLDMIRNREMVPDPDIVNILLLAFDKLRELINNIEESDEIDISEPIVSLAGLTTASLPDDEKKTISEMVDISLPDGKVVFTLPEFDFYQGTKGKKYLYLIEYDLIHDVHKKDKTPIDVMDVLRESGMILESKIDIASVGTLEDDPPSNRLPFFVLFATIVEPDHMSTLCEIDDRLIHLISEDMIAKSSDQDGSKDVPVLEEPQSQPEVSEVFIKPEEQGFTPDIEDSDQESIKALSSSKAETSLRVNVSSPRFSHDVGWRACA